MYFLNRMALFHIFFLFSSFCYSDTYKWYAPNIGEFSSPIAACDARGGALYSSNPKYVSSSVSVSGVNATCTPTIKWSDGTTSATGEFVVSRVGDSCDAGKTYNSNTGLCESDCAVMAGVTNFSLSSANKDVSGSGVRPVNNRMCSNSCQYVYTSGGSTSCGALKSNPDSYYCVFTYTGNGQSCDGSEEASNSGAPATTVPPKDPNDPTDPANNCGKGYAWSGSTCVKYWEDEKDTSTTPKPPTGGGGSGGGSSGGGGAGGGTGTGDAPAPGTENNGGGGGAGEGKDDDKDIEASSSQDCKKPPACDGDVFSCAILNQSYFDSCRLISLPTEKEKIGRDKEIDIQQDLIQQSQDQLDSQVSGFLSKFMSAGSGNYGGGKCYPDKQVSIGGHSLQLPFSQICDPLVILRYGLIAAAYLAAARILSKEV
ncbi:hypothetical protein ALP50_200229 [Pseudomonas syringae pv. spinaceae]|uniref:Membrane protein n=1 Tax=Pseudomonas syringae pv. spinaceae TaxID=264459 RepID=A0A0Q0C7P0_PSESX|nr:virulence factor TspB C-terminal domain-related protein [Pseudomonas syringae]KPZ03862.1 membrane protein [Pseudomonas syringae pv. spinaceae]RMT32599.1 hypothetical protein ALP50_200229 [Pseudomonas syringae pv. spinaceae]